MTTPTAGQNRANPLKPPKPLFFTDPNATQADINVTAEEATVVRRISSSPNAKRSSTSPLNPDSPPSTASVHKSRSQAISSDGHASVPSSSHSNVNPFSPPASVSNFSALSEGEEVAVLPSLAYDVNSVVGHFPIPTPSSRSNSFIDMQGRTTVIGSRPSTSGTTNTAMRKSFASPPTRPVTIYNTHQGQLSSLMATKLAAPKRARSTMLTGEIHKPWLEKKDPYDM